jgi:hypothetical protein
VTARKICILVCDSCGEVFDHQNETITAARHAARALGWAKPENGVDKCGVCNGKFIRSDYGWLPARKEDE